MSEKEDTSTIDQRGGDADAHFSMIQKVAIIGSGLAGLHAAHLLSETAELRSRFDVHLFEANDQLGLDGSSISIDDVRIDVPLRSFNAGECIHLPSAFKQLLTQSSDLRILSQPHEIIPKARRLHPQSQLYFFICNTPSADLTFLSVQWPFWTSRRVDSLDSPSSQLTYKSHFASAIARHIHLFIPLPARTCTIPLYIWTPAGPFA
jgi:hypothetical protein